MLFYKSSSPLTQGSKPISTMGFTGYTDISINEDKARELATKHLRVKFLHITYCDWVGKIEEIKVIIFTRGKPKVYEIPEKYLPSDHISKFILLAIRDFGFTEFAKPSEYNPERLSEYFEPFTREWVKKHRHTSDWYSDLTYKHSS